ncbi:MAG: hypothetical protein ACE5HZ_07905 [Fidelibacterota bacterium]
MTDVPRCVVIFSLLFLPISTASSQEFNGELSGLIRTVDDGSLSSPVTVGVRYIPTYDGGTPRTGSFVLDYGVSVDFSASYEINSSGPVTEASPYRLWMRYSTHRFESRLGLQKISFGPARLLRSLMWFDRLDPQDPLQLAEGVYGLRLRYVFRTNANVWLWGLYGNEGTKGIELTPTEEESPEVGGRFQYPVGNGEMAVTAHSRVIELSGERLSEQRIALDGVWDVGMGILFESALIKTDLKDSGPSWQSFLTLGTDYTFGVGNGLTVLWEHLRFGLDVSPFGTATEKNMSGMMMTYPLGLMDQLSYFSFYDWTDSLPYHYMSWQRTLDAWIVHLSIFWSRETGKSAEESLSIAGFGRKGIQFMIIFNH